VPVDPARLRDVPLFEGLDDDELAEIADQAELKPASPGDVLAREGASGYTFFVILDGSVDVHRDGQFLETLGAGDFFGEMAIMGGGRRNATVTAASPVETLVLFGTDLRVLEDENAHASERLRQKIAERVARARGSV
jgi:CRP-like cAMP-binding protein